MYNLNKIGVDLESSRPLVTFVAYWMVPSTITLDQSWLPVKVDEKAMIRNQHSRISHPNPSHKMGKEYKQLRRHKSHITQKCVFGGFQAGKIQTRMLSYRS